MSTDNDKRGRVQRALNRVGTGTCCYCGVHATAARKVTVEVPIDQLDAVSRAMLDSEKGREFRRGPARYWIVCQPCDSALRSRPQLSEALALASAFLGVPPTRSLQRVVENRYREPAAEPWTAYAAMPGAHPDRPQARPWQHLDVEMIRAASVALDGPIPCPSGGGCGLCGVAALPADNSDSAPWVRVNGQDFCGPCSEIDSKARIEKVPALALVLVERLGCATATAVALVRTAGLQQWSRSGLAPSDRPWPQIDFERCQAWADEFEAAQRAIVPAWM